MSENFWVLVEEKFTSTLVSLLVFVFLMSGMWVYRDLTIREHSMKWAEMYYSFGGCHKSIPLSLYDSFSSGDMILNYDFNRNRPTWKR